MSRNIVFICINKKLKTIKKRGKKVSKLRKQKGEMKL